MMAKKGSSSASCDPFEFRTEVYLRLARDGQGFSDDLYPDKLELFEQFMKKKHVQMKEFFVAKYDGNIEFCHVAVPEEADACQFCFKAFSSSGLTRIYDDAKRDHLSAMLAAWFVEQGIVGALHFDESRDFVEVTAEMTSKVCHKGVKYLTNQQHTASRFLKDDSNDDKEQTDRQGKDISVQVDNNELSQEESKDNQAKSNREHLHSQNNQCNPPSDDPRHLAETTSNNAPRQYADVVKNKENKEPTTQGHVRQNIDNLERLTESDSKVHSQDSISSTRIAVKSGIKEQSTAIKQTRVYKKRFMFYVPKNITDKYGQVVKMSIESDQPELKKLELHKSHNYDCMWISEELYLPEGKTILYKYKTRHPKGALKKLTDIITTLQYSETESVLEETFRECNAESGVIAQRDISMPKKLQKWEERNHLFIGKYHHVKFMAMVVNKSSLKEYLVEREHMKFPDTYHDYSEVKTFLCAVQSIFENKNNLCDAKTAGIFLTVAIGNLVINHKDIFNYNISESACKWLLESLQYVEKGDVLSSSFAAFIKVIPRIHRHANSKETFYREDVLQYIFPLCNLSEIKKIYTGCASIQLDQSFPTLTPVILHLCNYLPRYPEAAELLIDILKVVSCTKTLLEIENSLSSLRGKVAEDLIQGLVETAHSRFIQKFEVEMKKLVVTDDDFNSAINKWNFVLIQSRCHMSKEILDIVLQIKPVKLFIWVKKTLLQTSTLDAELSEYFNNNCVAAALATLRGELEKCSSQINKIFDLWCLITSDQALMADCQVNKWFSEAIVTALSRSTTRQSILEQHDVELIEKLSFDRHLFNLDKEDYLRDLLSALARSRNDNVHYLCFKLLQTLPKEVPVHITSVATVWYDALLERVSYGSLQSVKKVQEILAIYTNLLGILSCPCVQHDVKLGSIIDNKTKTFLAKYYSALVLIPQLDEMEKAAAEIQQKFEEHLIEIMTNSKHSLTSISLKFEAFNSSMAMRLFKTLLDRIKMPASFNLLHPDYQEDLQSILKKWQFWQHVFCAEGIFASEIREHHASEQVKAFLVKTCECILNQQIAVPLAKDLIKSIETTGFEKCDLLMCLVYGTNWSSAFTNMKSEVDKAVYITDKLKEFLACYRCIFETMSLIDLDMLKNLVQERYSQLTTEYSLMVIDANKWGPAATIIEHIKKLCPIGKSEVFITYCMNYFKHLDLGETKFEESLPFAHDSTDSANVTQYNVTLLGNSSQKVEIAPSDPVKLSVVWLVKLLATDVLTDFLERIQPFFNEQDIPVKEVAILFGNSDIQKELGIIGHYQNSTLPQIVTEAFVSYQEFPHKTQEARDLRELLKTFHLKTKDDDECSRAINLVLECENTDDITLFQLSRGVEKLRLLGIDAHMWEVISELTRSKNLLKFLRDNIDEDFRNLIDAVEEHSESFVREAEVSHLIEVKRFVQTLILMTNGDETVYVEEFLQQLRAKCSEPTSKDINMKLKSCTDQFHALKALYASVANRGELTKEIIQSLLQCGVYRFSLSEGKCKVSASYSQKEASQTFSLNDLNDLRSRALLIINKDREEELKLALSKFIEVSETVQKIVQTCTELHTLGHFDYREYNETVADLADLKQLSKKLRTDKKNWIKILEDARLQYYFLNFVYSDQIWALYDFFTCQKKLNQERALSILRFIDPTICLNDVTNTFVPPITDKLQLVGERLNHLMSKRPNVYKPLVLPKNETDVRQVVKPGELFVIHLDHGSPFSIATILKLYAATTQCYPKAYQLLFCSTSTSWEAIHLLLQRCTLQPKGNQKSLFCIANVELLSNDLQFGLVDEITKIYEESQGRPRNFLLSIVCRGSATHPILDRFSDNTHKIHAMLEGTLESCLRSVCPEVTTVTSSHPGLGKSEQACQTASEYKKELIRFPISGPFDKFAVINRLQKSRITETCLLHLDIAEVDDPLKLDMFLFEMIVLKMVSAGTTIFHLPTQCIVVEIANTLNNWLKDNLVTCTCFKRKHIEWQNYDNYIVSQEILSPVQVVCQYLDAIENAKIDSKDIYLVGSHAFKPICPDTCKKLLQNHLSMGDDMTFSVVEVFLNVLADQLRKFSTSPYFRTKTLKDIHGDEPNAVRSTVVNELVNVYKEFSSRSVKSYRESQSEVVDLIKTSSLIMTATSMVDRTDGMIRWNDSNHLLVVFHTQDFNTISALYRKTSRVPEPLKKLFKSQLKTDLPDYNALKQSDLQNVLEKLVRASRNPLPSGTLPLNYALTPDNLLKMTLIFLRIKAGVPVIIMGETGCGKTSLISYLAKTCQCHLQVFNFHAGIQEEDILNNVENVNNMAKANPDKSYWLFLDEINTCDHLGLVNEILCHKYLLGKPLMPNVVFLAACNPYRLRDEDQILTAGLEGKAHKDEFSRLVYRVNPLPESMIDYLWDYGFLSIEDEKAYILRMAKDRFAKKEEMLIDLLASSQQYIRDHDRNSWCVSLRDVNRCITTMEWFATFYLPLKAVCDTTVMSDDEIQLNAIILGLAHCYHSRLPTTRARRQYYSEMANIMQSHGVQYVSDRIIGEIIRKEQEDLLNKMDLPESTAKNTALRENVFVILVCILNRIPIFLVGKPGCSKSLSVQLIRSNLRGEDSKHPFFKKLPQLFVVSYQGSESSTSEGIIKVFEKARRYKDPTTGTNVLPVVLLDEIGLAEQSQFNPLKVLHSYLEPAGGDYPDIAVVGISNWALDAAKMNRANHLSRPEPDQAELKDTAISISTIKICQNMWLLPESQPQERQRLSTDDIKAVSTAYYEYQKNQRHRNFHGLRDYYSLIKYLCNKAGSVQGNVNIEQWKRGLLRNFGGLQSETHGIVNKFMEYIDPVEKCDRYIPVKSLVKDNINDKLARHLMLITHGDSALGILENYINLHEREHEIIFGSRFEEDFSEDYSYRILSRIILCMERGVILVLKDLDNIYGSLYDMLNQNYTVVGKKKNCRIALGPYSNPMCQVHEEFRCIVLVDENKVDYSDPPFLNRFEKQLLTFADVLTDSQKDMISELDTWVYSMCTIEALKGTFGVADAIVGYCVDTLPSLVLHHYPQQELGVENITQEEKMDVLNRCKSDLLWLMSPDAMLRASRSQLAEEKEVQHWQQEYFHLPLHDGLKNFIRNALSSDITNGTKCFKRTEDRGVKIIVQTRTNIMFDTVETLHDVVYCQTEKLSYFKSEKQLTSRIRQFWFDSNKEMLILQCKPSLDGLHMLLAKALIDNCCSEFQQLPEIEKMCKVKHVCIIIHIDREPCDDGWQFNFLSGWSLVTLDSLETPKCSIPNVLGRSVTDVLENGHIVKIEDAVKDSLIWAFQCISYAGKSRSQEDVLKLLENIAKTDMPTTISKKILSWIGNQDKVHQYASEFEGDTWQVRVASDSMALKSSSTLLSAFTSYVRKRILDPLVMIVYRLESFSAWLSYFDTPQQEIWKQIWDDPNNFNIDDVPLPEEVGSYQIEGVPLDMSFPFSIMFIKKIEEFHDLFLEGYNTYKSDPDNLDNYNELKTDKMAEHQCCICDILTDSVPLLFHILSGENINKFLDDFCQYVTAKMSYPMKFEECALATKWAVTHSCTQQQIDKDLHGIHAVRFITSFWARKDRVYSILHLISVCKEVSGTDVHELISQVDPNCNCLEEETLVKSVYSHSENSNTNIERNLCTDVTTTEIKFEKDNETELKKYADSGDTDELRNDLHLCETTSETHLLLSLNTEDDHGMPLSQVVDKHDEMHLPQLTEPNGEQENKDDWTLEDTLVSVVCQKMLPTENVTSACGSVEQWQHKINLVLSVALEVSSYPPIFHFLRVCNDFATNVLIPYDLNPTLLSQIAESDNGPEDTLESNILFKKVMEIIHSLVQDKPVTLQAAQKFVCLFLGRCYDANPESPAVELFLNRIVSGEVPDAKLTYFGTVVDRILVEDTANDPQAYFDLLDDKEDTDSFVSMSKLENAFVACNTGAESPLAIIVCDIIEKTMYHHLQQEVTINTLDCETGLEFLCLLQKAQEVLQEGRIVTMKLIIAVAFLKSYVRCLAKILTSSTPFIDTDQHVGYLQQVSSLFDCSSMEPFLKCRNEAVTHFFLKTLRKNRNFVKIRKICSENMRKLPTLQNLTWKIEDELSNPLVYRIHSREPFYHEAFIAYQKLLQSDDLEMQSFLSTNNAQRRMALAAVLVDNVYLVSAQRKLKDTEKLAHQNLSTLIADDYNFHFQQLVKNLTLQESFAIEELLLSPVSSYEEVQKASVLVHLLCLVITYSDIQDNMLLKPSLFARAVFDPASLRNCYIPSCFSYKKIEILDMESKCQRHTCICWHRVVVGKSVRQCCVCNSDFEDDVQHADVGGSSHTEILAQVAGFSTATPKHKYPCSLTTVSYNILSALLNGALMCGASYTSTNSIAYIDEVTQDKGPGVDWCKKRFLSSWESLTNLLCLPNHRLCLLLHVILCRLKQLLVDGRDFSTPQEQTEWETWFTQEVNEIVANKHRLLLHTVREYASVDGPDNNKLESLIDELPIFSEEESVHYLPSLFRITPEKSLDTLCGLFRSEGKNEQHQFLSYFFSNIDKLCIIQSLAQILIWLKEITKHKSHHVTRKDSKQSVKEILHDMKITDKDRNALAESFNSFIKSWNNKIHPFVKMLSEIDPEIKELPVLHDELSLQECVASTKHSIIFKVISALAKLQNAFLDTVSELAVYSQMKSGTSKCTAVSFLVRGKLSAVVSIVPLHEARPDQIIACNWKEWKDDILKYSQYNTEYGMGYDIQYDFGKIEMELANRLVLGKAFLLLNDSFPLFSYARELQSYTSILVHAEKAVPQQALTADIANRIQEKHANNPSDTRSLLFHLDIILRMLQRPHSTVQHPFSPLISYADKWYNVVGSQFPKALLPEPSDSVKLCHIVALYEHLEELLFEKAEEKLPVEYREKLDEAIEDQLETRLKVPKTPLGQIVKVLRRFIFRYISTSEDRTPDTTLPLTTHLESYSRQPHEETDSLGGGDDLPSIFPPIIKIAHIHDAVKLTEKVHVELLEKSKSLKSAPQKQYGTKASAGKGRRRTSNYSRT